MKCKLKLEKAYRFDDHDYDSKAAFFRDKRDEICG
jgi:hypothetical protein